MPHPISECLGWSSSSAQSPASCLCAPWEAAVTLRCWVPVVQRNWVPIVSIWRLSQQMGVSLPTCLLSPCHSSKYAWESIPSSYVQVFWAGVLLSFQTFHLFLPRLGAVIAGSNFPQDASQSTQCLAHLRLTCLGSLPASLLLRQLKRLGALNGISWKLALSFLKTRISLPS